MENFLSNSEKKPFSEIFNPKLSTRNRKAVLITQISAFFVDDYNKKLFKILPFDYVKAELLRFFRSNYK